MADCKLPDDCPAHSGMMVEIGHLKEGIDRVNNSIIWGVRILVANLIILVGGLGAFLLNYLLEGG